MLMEEKGNERWSAAIANLSDISNDLHSLHNILNSKAVYVDQDSFNKASLTSDQARTIKVLEQRVETLERELENTTKVFELHMEELRAKQDEIAKRDNEIKLLEAIIQTLGGKDSDS
ncbi:hypothetical protein HanIR_Chr10g0478551 [Helianthus annuus]|nr:hypothetical protein HanIR_Chr10g0478551 [Helianthus annuus]